MQKQVLVLGSAPGAVLPQVTFEHVYFANGAVFRAAELSGCKKTAVVSRGSLLDRRFSDKVKNIDFDRMVTRLHGHSGEYLENLFSRVEVVNLSLLDDRELQVKAFGCLPLVLDLYLAVVSSGGVSYKASCLKNAIRLNFRRGEITHGASTGLFALVFALFENPEQTVVLSGVSMMSGLHFNSSAVFGATLARVDRILFRAMHQTLKERVVTTDQKLAKCLNIRYLCD